MVGAMSGCRMLDSISCGLNVDVVNSISGLTDKVGFFCLLGLFWWIACLSLYKDTFICVILN